MQIPRSVYQDNPSFPLIQSLVSYSSTTNANGNALGTTVVDIGLANQPSFDGLAIKIMSGASAGQARVIHVHAGNTLTVAAPFTNAAGAVQQILAGTKFVILSSISSGGGPGPAPEEGLVYYGIVDAVPGANQFTIGSLAGLGAGKFAGATNPYSVFILRDAGGAGAAPQGEIQVVTAYVTATGTFTTVAFTAAIGVGDEVIIMNPAIANILVILGGLNVPVADAVTNVLMRDVIGNKTSTAIYAKTNTADIIRYLKGLLDAGIAVAGSVNDAGPAITDFDTNLAEATDDHYNGMLLMFMEGPNIGQAHVIDNYAGATRNVSFAANDQWTDVPVNGDDFIIMPAPGAYLMKLFLAIGYEGATSLANKLTAARAGYLDNLIGTVSVAGSPFSLVNNVNEQDAIVVAAATQLVDIELDMSNLTQNNTVREYVQVDGANYRQISAKVFPTDFDTGTMCVLLSFPQKNVLYKITMQAAVLEGAARDVPYRILTRDLS